MEFTFYYFWIISLTLFLLGAGTAYKAISVHKLKSKTWNIIALIVGILFLVTPVKLTPTTDKANSVQNYKIEQQKVLPPLVSDNSFEKSTQVQNITTKDLE